MRVIPATGVRGVAIAPAAPQLIPAGNVRAYLRAITVFDICDAIVIACRTAWDRVATDAGTGTSITPRAMEQARGKGRRYFRETCRQRC